MEKKYLIGLAVVLILVLAFVYRKKIMEWLGMNGNGKKDGDKCTTSDNQEGQYKNGVCVPLSGGPQPTGETASV